MTNIVMLIGPDRYRLTRQALDTLSACTDPLTYNLTLVLDSPDFRTEALAKKYLYGMEFTTVLLVENSGHTLSQLKNLGVAWSEQRFGRGEWLYISDSDVCFTPGWLDKLTNLSAITEKMDFRLWGGQIHPFHQSIKEFDTRSDGLAMTEHSILDGPSWLMRWDTWNRYGPFDRTTAPGVCQSEEYPFCERLTKPRQLMTGDGNGGLRHLDGPGGRIGVISPHVVYHTGMTHSNGESCVGRAEREALIPPGVITQ